MTHLSVDLGDRSYPIFIQDGLLAKPDTWESHCSDQILVVTNETLAEKYAKPLVNVFSSNQRIRLLDCLVLPDGEKYKTLATVNTIFDTLLSNRFNRTATLVAVGGGVVGDMVGFAAATYQRGVNFVQVPTTLLAQVDSSVGGKTGVNHPLGKNMVGAFYQPQCVVIDLDVLKTLPSRELSAGLAEVIKYGLIYDADFFCWLEKNIELLLEKNSSALHHAILRSCEIKADVVSQDEREAGIRAILNLGHTFGHAIEAHEGYGEWLHGEAVGVGMLMAIDLSLRHGWVDQEDYHRAHSLIEKAGLPVEGPLEMKPEDYLKYMAVDKKVLSKTLRLVLLKSLGNATVTEAFEPALLTETLDAFCPQ